MRTKKTNVIALAAVIGFASAFCVCAGETIDESRRNAIVRAIERAAPAVVSINVIQVEATRVLDPFARDFWDFFSFPQPRYLLRQKQVNSVGSGFFFDDKGHIVTNYHVIEGADAVASVGLADGRVLEVEIVGMDRRTDLAVLRAKGTDLPGAALGDSEGLLIGEWVIAIGNPFGGLMRDPQPTVSVGVVSANHRRVSPNIGEGERLYQDMIQTDAAVNPGNSGGPLVDAHGRVVGVNTMIFTPSGGNVGLGFAIPIKRARRVAEEIVKYGRRRDPWAGFNVEDVASLREDFRRELGVTVDTGCVVANILTDAPAYEAGLRPGDVIVDINGQPVTYSHELDFGLWSLFVGDSVALEVLRGAESRTIRFSVKELTE